jgi:hypothetical protein
MDMERFRAIVPKIDAILARGLSEGVGTRGKQVCVEAAICEALDLPHGDDPKCVSRQVREFKIRLNDSQWSSPEARAKGLRDLAVAQLGSDQINENEFCKRLREKTIRVLIPKLFREVLSEYPGCLAAADACEREGGAARAAEAAGAAWAARAAGAAWAAGAAGAAEAARAAGAARAAEAAEAARTWAARAAQPTPTDEYLILSANLALEVFKEMGAPGVSLL